MHAAIFATAALAAASTAWCANCACGYTFNIPDYSGSITFTEAIETDFLHIGDLSTDAQGQWIPQVFNTTPEHSNGPYGKIAQAGNVVANPVGSKWDWQGPGVRGDDPGLQLWVRQDHVPSPDGDGSMVPMAEIVSQRDDILYGSFRIGMKSTSVNGTCGAFFWYLSDSQEIDVEILSKDQSSNGSFANFVVQSPESVAKGYVASGPDFDHQRIGVEPQLGYNEFRFDWLPDRIIFYANGEQLTSITENIPNTPGALHMNHWSNGNEGWSAGPPEQDAVLTITYAKAYFNSSHPDVTAKATAKCPSARQPGEETCQIPDQRTPPDPTGTNGNSTGRTFFFDNPAVNVAKPMHSGAASAVRAVSSGWQTVGFGVLCAAVLVLLSGVGA